jgi:hypothetical protein
LIFSVIQYNLGFESERFAIQDGRRNIPLNELILILVASWKIIRGHGKDFLRRPKKDRDIKPKQAPCNTVIFQGQDIQTSLRG